MKEKRTKSKRLTASIFIRLVIAVIVAITSVFVRDTLVSGMAPSVSVFTAITW